MGSIAFQTVLDIVSDFGLPGLLLVMWWISDRSHQRTLNRYHDDVQEIRNMYESNVRLVEHYEALARDLKDVVVMNTQAFTHLAGDIETNQYCPQVRLQKKSSGVLE